MKTCIRCLIDKPDTEFYVANKKYGYLRTDCKSCVKKKSNLRFLEKNAEIKEHRKQYYAVNSEYFIQKSIEWGKNNPEKYKKNQKSWRDKNPDKIKQNTEDYMAIPENKAKRYAGISKWKHKNLDKVSAYTSNRRAAELKRTPSWAKDMMKDYMPLIFKFRDALTKRTGIEQTVDHIVPLQAKVASGLHLLWNLAIVPASDNYSKQNKFEPCVINYKNGFPIQEDLIKAGLLAEIGV